MQHDVQIVDADRLVVCRCGFNGTAGPGDEALLDIAAIGHIADQGHRAVEVRRFDGVRGYLEGAATMGGCLD